MAVLTQIPEINVSVHVNGRPAKEYPPPDQHGDHTPSNPALFTHECYIESQSAQQYTVEVLVAPEYKFGATEGLLCDLSVDGRRVRATILQPTNCYQRRPLRHSFIGPLRLSTTSRRAIEEKMTFSPVTTVEEASKTTLERDAKVVADLGVIILAVSTCQIVGYGSTRVREQAAAGEALTIAEKSLKGKELSHGTRFTEGDAVPAIRRTCNVRGQKPIAKYMFRYRSRSALQREMILPRTSPTPQSSEPSEPPQPPEPSISDQILGMTDDEIRSLAQKYLRVKREEQIKSEKDETPRLKRTIDLTDGGGVEVSGHGKVKVVKLENGCELVDLT
ncbi:hypothetical protein E4U41_000274 [Claviceps citrina]|nr:hypothetical protein E4U41_000274 [Claviceps citrina]